MEMKSPFRAGRKGRAFQIKLELIDQVKRQHVGVVMNAAKYSIRTVVEGGEMLDMIPAQFHAAQHIRPKGILNSGREFICGDTGVIDSQMFNTTVEAQLVVDLIVAIKTRIPSAAVAVSSETMGVVNVEVVKRGADFQRGQRCRNCGTNIIAGRSPSTNSTGVGAIAVEEVPKERTHLYGIIDGEPAPQPPFGARLLRIRDVVEKPKPEKAPSNLAITGRYVLPPQIFDCLARTKPGAGNEIQLTDALRILAQEDGLWAYIYDGISYDAGDKLGFLKATVEIALQNKEFGNEFRQYLKGLKL